MYSCILQIFKNTMCLFHTQVQRNPGFYLAIPAFGLLLVVMEEGSGGHGGEVKKVKWRRWCAYLVRVEVVNTWGNRKERYIMLENWN